MVFVYSWSTLLWYRCYYPHRSRDLMSPIWGIFFQQNRYQYHFVGLSVIFYVNQLWRKVLYPCLRHLLQPWKWKNKNRSFEKRNIPSSCHPKQAIPFSLALRFVRKCYSPEDRVRRLRELSKSLVARGYNLDMVETAIQKVGKVPRERAVKKVIKKEGPFLATPFDPRLLAISSIKAKHWRTMSSPDR